MTKEEVLQDCTVEGNLVKLPEGQLDRKLYQEVAKALELIGGKWKGGKVMGFVFAKDPTDLLSQIANGENRNLKKEFQFFATPEELADRMVEMAQIEDFHRVLEPSAGQGAIVSAIHRQHPDVDVEVYELMDVNRSILLNTVDNSGVGRMKLKGFDFLESDVNTKEVYDRIIGNPPFTKNQDIDHLTRMYDLLKIGGMVVCITSQSWKIGTQKKQVAFAKWLEDLKAYQEELPKGTFKSSGTNVGAMLIKIIKK